MGGTWTPLVDASALSPAFGAGSIWTVGVSASPLDALLSPTIGVLLCDPAMPSLTQGSVAAQPGPTPYPLAVPAACSVIGASACTQAALLDPVNGIRLANAIDITVGTSVSGLCAVNSTNELLEIIDTATATTLSAISMTLPGYVVYSGNGLARDPLTGKLYVIITGVPAGPSPVAAASPVKSKRRKRGASGPAIGPADGPSGRILGTVCPSSGEVTYIGHTGDFFAAIAFDDTGTLWGVTGDGAIQPETLFTIDTTTGASTLVAALGNGSYGELLGFNPVDGLLYHGSGNQWWSGLPNILETIDPLNPTAIPMGLPLPSPLDVDETNALSSYQPSINGFYWASGYNPSVGANGLYVLTPGGSSVHIGNVSQPIKGLAVLP